MPLPLLAHQAPVLPLKLRWPAAWNGTALVLGSIAPDLEYLRMRPPTENREGLAHTVLGQLLVCLPVTVALVALIGSCGLGEVLAARLGPRFVWLARAATDVKSPGGLRRASLSALLGSVSHIVLDRISHRLIPSWLPRRMFSFVGLRWSTPTMVQLVLSAVGALVSLWCLRELARRTTNEAPARRPGVLVVVALALVGALVGALDAAPAIRNPDAYFEAGRFYVWGFAAFFAACGAGAGVLVAGLALAAVDRRARTR